MGRRILDILSWTVLGFAAAIAAIVAVIRRSAPKMEANRHVHNEERADGSQQPSNPVTIRDLPQSDPKQSPSGGPYQSERRHDDEQFPPCRAAAQSQTGLLILNGLLFLCNIAVAIGTWKAADATKEYAETTKAQLKHFELESRPWIGFDGDSADMGHIIEGAPPVLRVRAVNYGKTPGIIVRALLLIIPEPKSVNIDAEDFHRTDHGGAGVSTLAPGVGVNLRPFNPPVLGTADMEAITKEEKRLWVLGRLEYTDAAGNRYDSACCYIFEPYRKSFTAYEKFNYMH